MVKTAMQYNQMLIPELLHLESLVVRVMEDPFLRASLLEITKQPVQAAPSGFPHMEIVLSRAQPVNTFHQLVMV